MTINAGIKKSLNHDEWLNAIKEGNDPIFQEGLSKKGWINQWNKGVNALMQALEFNQIDMIRSLLDHGGDPCLKNKKEMSPLKRAARMGNAEALELFLEKNVDVNEQDKRGEHLLIKAVKSGNLKSVQLLIEKNADVNMIPPWGLSAAMLSLSLNSNSEAIFKELIKNGARIDEINHLGDTLLTVAVYNEDIKILELITQHADIKKTINQKNKSGLTALMIASQKTDGNQKENPADIKYKIQLLLKAGSDLNLKDRSGKTALDWALSHGDIPRLSTLMENMGLNMKKSSEEDLLQWEAYCLKVVKKNKRKGVKDFVTSFFLSQKMDLFIATPMEPSGHSLKKNFKNSL